MKGKKSHISKKNIDNTMIYHNFDYRITNSQERQILVENKSKY